MIDQSPADRGFADCWYGRTYRPHKTISGKEVALTDPDEIEEYRRAYAEFYDKGFFGEKDYG